MGDRINIPKYTFFFSIILMQANLLIYWKQLFFLLITGVVIQIIQQQLTKMTSFKSKIAVLKDTLSKNEVNEAHSPCQQPIILKECRTNNKQELSLQQPIIIQKKTSVKQQIFQKKTKVNESSANFQVNSTINYAHRKKVEPWVPVTVPVRDKRIDIESLNVPAPQNNNNKQIEIQIQKDENSKQCLKKLFKKIKKLEDQLKQSEKERVRLNLELENYVGRSKTCGQHQKAINKLQNEKYKLQIELDMTKKLLKQRQEEIRRLEGRVPKQIIKEVIVQKPVEVVVEIPKLVPGPQRIVQKIVEIPKYIEIEKKVPVEVIKQVQKEVIKTIEIPTPTIVEKPVYVEKPIYIERPPIQIQKRVQVPIQVPIQVPVQYPVYIQKPVIEEEFLIKMRELEAALEASLKENAIIGAENGELRIRVSQLSQNLQIMRRHNQEKNRQVEILLQHSHDFMPFSPQQQDISMRSVKYSISPTLHHRVI